MTTLIFLLLVAAVVVYAVFFLLFKIIWIILKKSSNKWPLILAGICTVLFSGAVIGTAAWGMYKVISPFRGMIDRYDEKQPPTYGINTYTDPRYGFSIDVYDGMDFSEWINFDDLSLKVGMDMNVLKKASENQNTKTMFALIARQTDLDADESPLQDLYEILDTAKKRPQFQIEEEKQVEINGKPGYYVSGRIYSNNGANGPFWLTALHDDKQNIYLLTIQIGGEQDTSASQKMAESLRLTVAEPLPSAV